MQSSQPTSKELTVIMTFNINNNTFVIALAVALVAIKYGAIAAYMLHTYGALSAF